MAYNFLEKVYRTQTSPIQTFLFNVGLNIWSAINSVPSQSVCTLQACIRLKHFSRFTQRVLNSTL